MIWARILAAAFPANKAVRICLLSHLYKDLHQQEHGPSGRHMARRQSEDAGFPSFAE